MDDRNKIKTMMNSCQEIAEAQGVEFELEDESIFNEIVLKPCFFCSTNILGSDSLFGITRIDQDESYDINNVIPTCDSCSSTRGGSLSVVDTYSLVNQKKSNKESTYYTISNEDIDIHNGVLFVFGEIDDTLAEKVVKQINFIETTTELDSITIHLSSLGGDLYSALAIYDILSNSDLEIKMVLHGLVASSGAIIALAGDERVCSDNTIFLVHGGSHYAESTPSSFTQIAQHVEYYEDLVLNILISNTKRGEKFWKDKSKTEYYFGKDEAIKIGFITKS